VREQEERGKNEGEVCVSLALFLTTTPPLILGFSVPNILLSWLCLPSELAFGYVSINILYMEIGIHFIYEKS